MRVALSFAALAGLSCMALSQWSYDRHIVFDNSLTSGSYYYSAGSASEPSYLELVGGRLPVDDKHSFHPPNALRLSWESAKGGAWEATVETGGWRNRNLKFLGDTLFLYCFSEEPLPASAMPAMFLADKFGHRTPVLQLSSLAIDLPAGRWIRLSIPLEKLAGEKRDTMIVRFIGFLQDAADGARHVLYLDAVRIDSGNPPKGAPDPPANVRATGYDRHVDLAWEPSPASVPVQYYEIYRSLDGGEFVPVGIQKGQMHRYADFIGRSSAAARYRIAAVGLDDQPSALSGQVSATTRPLTDDELLTMVQEASFRYYWEYAHPTAGMALENIPGDEQLVAVGASGFGIMAIVAGTDRGFVTRQAAADRILTIVRFLEKADRFHGAWPHFLNGRTGKVIPLFSKYDNGGDLVETAFLIQGLLAARQYFQKDNPQEMEIRQAITRLWRDVEWDWYRQSPDSDFLFWHWSPDYAWHINHPLVGWNETMIVYLLAIASPTHPVPSSMYYTGWAGQSERAVAYREAWGKTAEGNHYANGHTYQGITLDVGVGSGGPLFFTHYSFLGFDPHGKRDKYTEYFENNRHQALINHAYCIANPGGYAGYGDSCWGLTASDNPWRYKAHDPSLANDNGTMTPTGAVASFPYTPVESMKALKHFYYDRGPELWDIFGFRDAFNESQTWVANIAMGLNQAPMAVMIENYRTGLLWKLFMSNPEIGPMVKRIGFVSGTSPR